MSGNWKPLDPSWNPLVTSVLGLNGLNSVLSKKEFVIGHFGQVFSNSVSIVKGSKAEQRKHSGIGLTREPVQM